MKKIIFIYKGSSLGNLNAYAHCTWVKDCAKDYNIQYWGKGFVKDISLKALRHYIDSFQPDYIYMTLRKKYKYWLPNLRSIKVPKIFVEVDTQKYDRYDPWYDQFDRLLCREPSFGNWGDVPLFKWSAPEKAFPTKAERQMPKKGIRFLGHCTGSTYSMRKMLSRRLQRQVWFGKVKGPRYWSAIKQSAALLCPTESNFGDFIPAKLFEFLASGSAVLTNCDLNGYGCPELVPYVIQYKNLRDLRRKLKLDFTPYHNRTTKIMRRYTHRFRYKKLFG